MFFWQQKDIGHLLFCIVVTFAFSTQIFYSTEVQITISLPNKKKGVPPQKMALLII